MTAETSFVLGICKRVSIPQAQLAGSFSVSTVNSLCLVTETNPLAPTTFTYKLDLAFKESIHETITSSSESEL